jgi:hypothetical protein
MCTKTRQGNILSQGLRKSEGIKEIASFEKFLDHDQFWASAENTPMMLVQTICP